ncbi:hypothetical protein LINPERHAP2_LOCUS45329 [Linum perenne]
MSFDLIFNLFSSKIANHDESSSSSSSCDSLYLIPERKRSEASTEKGGGTEECGRKAILNFPLNAGNKLQFVDFNKVLTKVYQLKGSSYRCMRCLQEVHRESSLLQIKLQTLFWSAIECFKVLGCS